MKVSKVAVTDYGQFKNLKEYIAYVARVSNPSSQKLGRNSDRLINYLIRHKHWSPFEMASMTLEIVTTRDIGRQILRHRSFSFQEFSQRYADPTEENSGLDFVIRETRVQDTKNRQNSFEVEDAELDVFWKDAQQQVIDQVSALYKEAINRGIAKEQARAILPEGLMSSKIYMSGTIRSWIHYVQLRTDPGTQKEHREIAAAAEKILNEVLDLEDGVLENSF